MIKKRDVPIGPLCALLYRPLAVYACLAVANDFPGVLWDALMLWGGCLYVTHNPVDTAVKFYGLVNLCVNPSQLCFPYFRRSLTLLLISLFKKFCDSNMFNLVKDNNSSENNRM